jgi:hypothetical protein
MGTSTDAILIYGIPLHEYDECGFEELPFAEDGCEEFEDVIARRSGAAEYPEAGWIEQKHAAVDASPLCLVTHCSLDVPMWILGIKSTEVTARRGYPIEIQTLDTFDDAEEQALLAFASEFNIEGTPGWYLCSLWA